jgi:hypothetical protein
LNGTSTGRVTAAGLTRDLGRKLVAGGGVTLPRGAQPELVYTWAATGRGHICSHYIGLHDRGTIDA